MAYESSISQKERATVFGSGLQGSARDTTASVWQRERSTGREEQYLTTRLTLCTNDLECLNAFEYIMRSGVAAEL